MPRSLLLLLLALAGCASAPNGPAHHHVLVLLKTGPRTGLSPEESRTVFAGHFGNMQRLAEERKLLVAGPYVVPHPRRPARGESESLAADRPALVGSGQSGTR